MKYVELKANLKNKVESAYLISGEDRYLCFDALKKIEDALNISIKDMNSVSLSGGSVSAKDIVDAANIYPFGDAFRLLVVKGWNPTKNKEEAAVIQNYLKSPMQSTILVFFNPDGAEFFKGMSDITPVDCGKIEPKMASAYVKNYLAKNDIMSSDEAIEKLVLFSLCDMSKITSELEKLSAYVADSKVLTTEIVEKFVVQDREFQVYELAEFLAKGDSENAFKLIDSFMMKPGSAFALISPLFNNYRRALFVSINKDKSQAELASLLGVKEFAIRMLSGQVKVFSPKQLKQIVDLISEYDKKIKVGEMKENVAIKLIATSILTLRGKNV
jgi:DNA polymerase III delta subunit